MCVKNCDIIDWIYYMAPCEPGDLFYYTGSDHTIPGQPNQHQHYNNIIIRLCNIIIGTGELQEEVEVVNLVVNSPTQPPKRTTTQLADKVCLKLLAPNNNVIK